MAQSSLIVAELCSAATLYLAYQRGQCSGTSLCNGNTLAQTGAKCEGGFMKWGFIVGTGLGALSNLLFSSHAIKMLLRDRQGVQNERDRLTPADVIQGLSFWSLFCFVGLAYFDLSFLGECLSLYNCEAAHLEEPLAGRCAATVDWGMLNVFFAMIALIVNATFTFPAVARVFDRMLEQNCPRVSSALVAFGKQASDVALTIAKATEQQLGIEHDA